MAKPQASSIAPRHCSNIAAPRRENSTRPLSVPTLSSEAGVPIQTGLPRFLPGSETATDPFPRAGTWHDDRCASTRRISSETPSPAEPSRSSACAETPNGDHEPTVYDVQDAQRVKLALDLLAIPQIDYIIWHARLRSPRHMVLCEFDHGIPLFEPAACSKSSAYFRDSLVLDEAFFRADTSPPRRSRHGRSSKKN